MKKLLLVIGLALKMFGCTSIPDISTCNSKIYSYEIYNLVNVSNTVKLCLDGKHVLQEVYFPNTVSGSLPTTCRSKGTALYKNAGSVTIETVKGFCRNGRLFASSKMDCEINANSLTCIDSNYDYVMEFTR